MYYRINEKVFFVLPTMAIGLDEDGLWFVEIAWLNIAVGIA